MRKIVLIGAALCAFLAPSHAQKTKAQLNTEIGISFPDNTVNAITPAILRSVPQDIVNSILPTAPVVSGNLASYNGTTGLLQDSGIPGSLSAATLLGSIAGGTPAGIGLGSTLNFTTTLNCTTATASQIGCAKPDGTSITISGGVLSSVTAANVALLNGANVFTNINTFNAAVGLTAAETITLNNLIGLTLQDASSSQDTLTSGIASSVVCDPGYINGPAGSGQCAKFLMTPNAADIWGGLTLEAVNARAIVASIGGTINPEIICADTNTFGLPIWGNGGSNQAGCGYQGQTRTGSGAPVVFNITNGGHQSSTITASSATSSGGNSTITVTAESGAPIVFGEQIVGSGIPAHTTINGTSSTGNGNCSPSCTGNGGTGTYSVNTVTGTISSESMVGGPTGAEGSMQVGIFGGSLDGLTQNVLTFFNASICSAWNNACSGTPAQARLGELAGNAMTPDGKFTQTENVSVNFYEVFACSGTYTDGSYTCPSNIVFRQAPNSNNPERITQVFDYNANILVGTGWSSNSVGGGLGNAIYLRAAPANLGAVNMQFNKGSEQGISIQASASDTGSGNEVVFQNVAGTTIGTISGNATNVAYNTSSDRRLKTGIVPTSEIEVGRLIDKLQVVDFKFKADLSTTHIGFIAQDEYKAFPNAVTPGDYTNAQPGDHDFHAWQRDDSKLVPLLVREVQSLRQRVTHLEHHH